MFAVYVLVNTSLQMTPGKVSAQVAHAISGLFSKNRESVKVQNWFVYNPRAVIVLDGGSEEDLKRLAKYLKNNDITNYSYVDEGERFHVTALAVEPLDREDSRIQTIFKQFSLYTDNNKYLSQRVSDLEDQAENRIRQLQRYIGVLEGIDNRLKLSGIKLKGHYLSSQKRILRDIRKTIKGLNL